MTLVVKQETGHPQLARERVQAYSAAIAERCKRNDVPTAHYYLASLAVEELQIAANRGEDPPEETFRSAAYRLQHAAESNDGINELASLRARLLCIWMRPIVWAGIVNLEGLNDREARRVADNLGLDEHTTETTELTAEALDRHDALLATPSCERSKDEQRQLREIKGYIGEATPILLAMRHTTAKQFALPSLAYDDDINPDSSVHIDGFYYDNRRRRGDESIFSYQVEGNVRTHSHIAPHIPVVDAHLMGNTPKSSKWPNDDRGYATTRRLITERRGKRLSLGARTTLDHIASSVFNHVMHK